VGSKETLVEGKATSKADTLMEMSNDRLKWQSK